MARGGTLDSLHSSSIDSCAYQFLSWRPFSKTPTTTSDHHHPATKRHCRSDRATSSFSIDAILDMSKLSLFDDDDKQQSSQQPPLSFSAVKNRWFVRKRRRRGGSRSVSGRSSDRRGCCSAAAANGTCSDFPMLAGGTDSSGELFGEMNWASDVSDRKEREQQQVSGGEKEQVGGGGSGQFGNVDSHNHQSHHHHQGNESGYGSEPGYRGDAELGYDDEEEDDPPRALFWGDEFGDPASKLERVGENSLLKNHYRRRKKHDLRMVDNLR